MKYPIKKSPLKTINIFSVPKYCQVAHSIPLDPENKMPFVPLIDSLHRGTTKLLHPLVNSSLRLRRNKTLVKPVCGTAPNFVFWAPSCVPGFEYAQRLL